MTTHVALLRAVNLGPHNKVSMASLRDTLTDLGFTNVRSLLQSGNLLFDSARRTTSELERMLESAAAEQLGLNTEFFVRTAKEWKAAVAENPFPKQARDEPARLVLLCLKDAPDRKCVLSLRNAITGREEIHGKDRHLYAVYPDGIGRSRLTIGLIEKTLGTRGTGRNWNTVLKPAALLAAPPA